MGDVLGTEPEMSIADGCLHLQEHRRLEELPLGSLAETSYCGSSNKPTPALTPDSCLVLPSGGLQSEPGDPACGPQWLLLVLDRIQHGESSAGAAGSGLSLYGRFLPSPLVLGVRSSWGGHSPAWVGRLRTPHTSQTQTFTLFFSGGGHTGHQLHQGHTDRSLRPNAQGEG